MDQPKARPSNDLFSQSVDVLGEDFWQEIGELIPNTGPRIDVYHTSVTVVVTIELPGLRHPEQIAIHLAGQSLIVEGDIPCLYPVSDNRITRQERFFGHFRRTLLLPQPVSRDGIKAEYDQGLLIVELPVDASARETGIPVEFK